MICRFFLNVDVRGSENTDKEGKKSADDALYGWPKCILRDSSHRGIHRGRSHKGEGSLSKVEGG